MAKGSELTSKQVQDAIAFALRGTTLPWRCGQGGGGGGALGGTRRPFVPAAVVDEAFVRSVADWQEANIGLGAGDGKIGPKTEAYMGIQHPKATKAVEKALAIQKAGMILFDSWGNDVRDNNNDGVADDQKEKQPDDGAHFNETFASFSVVAGTYNQLGWQHNKSLTITKNTTVQGPFKYRVCADVVSRAYHEAGVMSTVRSTAVILQNFREKGFVWKKSEGFPSEFLPGDFICSLGHGGGHSGIVTTRAATSTVPIVFELPGPSTKVDLGTYDPTSSNDVRVGPWTKQGVDAEFQFLGRLLQSKLK